jgi:tight adherence protein B
MMRPETQTLLQIALMGGLFLGLLMVFEAIRQIVSRSENASESRNRRMRRIASGAARREALELVKPTQGARAPLGMSVLGGLPAALRQAGWSMSPAVFLTMAISSGAVTAFLIGLAAPLPFALSAGTVSIMLPFAVLTAARRKRMERFARQLPEALDLMARGLRVGHPLNTSVAAVARDLPEPVSREFGILVDQVAYGGNLVDAFLDLADRIDT